MIIRNFSVTVNHIHFLKFTQSFWTIADQWIVFHKHAINNISYDNYHQQLYYIISSSVYRVYGLSNPALRRVHVNYFTSKPAYILYSLVNKFIFSHISLIHRCHALFWKCCTSLIWTKQQQMLIDSHFIFVRIVTEKSHGVGKLLNIWMHSTFSLETGTWNAENPN